MPEADANNEEHWREGSACEGEFAQSRVRDLALTVDQIAPLSAADIPATRPRFCISSRRWYFCGAFGAHGFGVHFCMHFAVCPPRTDLLLHCPKRFNFRHPKT